MPVFTVLQEIPSDGYNKRGKSKNFQCPAKMKMIIQLRTSKDMYAKVIIYDTEAEPVTCCFLAFYFVVFYNSSASKYFLQNPNILF